MSDREERLLVALAWMAQQYLAAEGVLDHLCMRAGERAIAALAEYGLVINQGRESVWTDAGLKFLDEH